MSYTLVTGATSDIGQQICRTLEGAGHSLLLSDLCEDRLNETILSLQHPERHVILALDLSDVMQAESTLTDFILANRLQITNAVFAAGIFDVKPVRMANYSFVKKSFDIALFSIISITRILTSKKVNANSLRGIVMISSISAIKGNKGYATYGSVKAAMLGLMKSLAVELAPRVRVNAVLPGGIRTRATQFLYDMQEQPDPSYLLGDGNTNDVANSVEFLLSDKARWITGQTLVVDGGLSSH